MAHKASFSSKLFNIKAKIKKRSLNVTLTVYAINALKSRFVLIVANYSQSSHCSDSAATFCTSVSS